MISADVQLPVPTDTLIRRPAPIESPSSTNPLAAELLHFRDSVTRPDLDFSLFEGRRVARDEVALHHSDGTSQAVRYKMTEPMDFIGKKGEITGRMSVGDEVVYAFDSQGKMTWMRLTSHEDPQKAYQFRVTDGQVEIAACDLITRKITFDLRVEDLDPAVVGKITNFNRHLAGKVKFCKTRRRLVAGMVLGGVVISGGAYAISGLNQSMNNTQPPEVIVNTPSFQVSPHREYNIPEDVQLQHIRMLQLMDRIAENYRINRKLVMPILHQIIEIAEGNKYLNHIPGEELAFLVADKISPDQIHQLMRGNTSVDETAFLENNPQVNIDKSAYDKGVIPGGQKMVGGIFNAMVNTDRGRIKELRISTTEGHNMMGTVLTELGIYDEFEVVKLLLHELFHATDPKDSFLIFDGDEYIINLPGYNIADCFKIENEWLGFILRNKEFMDAYIFGAEGDSLHGFLLEGDVQRVVSELTAITTVNYLFGQMEGKNDHESGQAYKELEKLVRKQLAITVFGVKALASRPDGITLEELETVRSKIGVAYIQYFRSQMTERVAEELNRLLEERMHLYYENNPMGVYADMMAAGSQRTGLPTGNFYTSADYEQAEKIYDFVRKYGKLFWPDGKIQLS